MQADIEWVVGGNTEPPLVTSGLKPMDQRIFTFTPKGQPGDQHLIAVYDNAGSLIDIRRWRLRGPGGSAGPILWEMFSQTPVCRMIIGDSIYSTFAGNKTLQVVGVKAGEQYALAGVWIGGQYTGPQPGDSVVLMVNGG